MQTTATACVLGVCLAATCGGYALWPPKLGEELMKKLSVGLVLVGVLVLAGVVPAGAVAARTLPLVANCGDGPVLFHIIEGEGSLVGFEDPTDRPVVLHGVDGKFIIDIFIDDNEEPVGTVEQIEDFLKGKGTGLKLTECVADHEVPVFSDTFPLDDATAELIFAEFGIEVNPEEGDEVTLTGRFEGTLQVQFPGR